MRALVLTALLSLVVAAPVAADSVGGVYGHHMWEGGGMFMGFGMMAIFLVAVVVIIIFLVKGLSGNSQSAPPSSSALDILNERYAKGEIDTAEYEERKQKISGSN